MVRGSEREAQSLGLILVTYERTAHRIRAAQEERKVRQGCSCGKKPYAYVTTTEACKTEPY